MYYTKRIKALLAVTLSLLLTATIAFAATNPSNFGSAEWAANNWHEAVRYLDHITDNTVQQRMLAVPDTEGFRQQVWHDFWVKYDPVIETEVNEYRQKYFERIEYANEHFTTKSQLEGWLTDRGEAYIKLGPPSDVEKLKVATLDGAPLYVWDYKDAYGTTLFFLDYGNQDVYLLNPEQVDENRPVKWNVKRYY